MSVHTARSWRQATAFYRHGLSSPEETDNEHDAWKTPDRLFSGRISKEEARIRRDLAACYRLVALYGWEDMPRHPYFPPGCRRRTARNAF